MKNFTKGDRIEHVDKKTNHVVESVESIEDITVVFTEDSKCFPINKIRKYEGSVIGSFFSKLLRGEQVTKEEEEIAIYRMKNLNVVYIDRG